jgi:predicted DNA-binding transcriptional regulator AlpA
MTKTVKRAPRRPSPPPHELRLVRDFGNLPDHSFVKTAVLQGLLGCSRATIWRRCESGALPKPLRQGGHILGWRVGDIRAFIDSAAH